MSYKLCRHDLRYLVKDGDMTKRQKDRFIKLTRFISKLRWWMRTELGFKRVWEGVCYDYYADKSTYNPDKDDESIVISIHIIYPHPDNKPSITVRYRRQYETIPLDLRLDIPKHILRAITVLKLKGGNDGN